jgi:hypothetical protein
MSLKPIILVALPAYNEAKYIGSLLDKIKQYADKIIVVNDGSVDGTGDIAFKAGAIVVEHETNMGYGAAIQSIFETARDRTFDVLVIMDADSQHSVADLPRIGRPIIEGGYDVVIGHRNERQIPIYRQVGQKVLSKFVDVLANVNVDSQSGFRAYSPKAVAVLHPKENGMAVSSELVNLATQAGLKIIEVPISVKYLTDSSTHNPIVQGVDTLTRIIRMISERKPLLFFGLGGLIITVCGVALGIKAYFMLVEHAGALPIGTALVSFLLMVVGVFSVFTGIILDVVSKIKT